MLRDEDLYDIDHQHAIPQAFRYGVQHGRPAALTTVMRSRLVRA